MIKTLIRSQTYPFPIKIEKIFGVKGMQPNIEATNSYYGYEDCYADLS